MPLSAQRLRSSLQSAFRGLTEPSRSVVRGDAADAWAAVYHSYASAARTPTGGSPTSLEGQLSLALGSSREFLTGLANAVRLYWTSTVWTPAGGFTFLTLSAVGLEALLSPVLAANLSESSDLTEASRRIADALHTYTTSLVLVSATNVTSGATSVVNIS